MSIQTIIRRLRASASDESGVIALMTLAFLVLLGMVMVVFLWTIGFTTGAYSTLQGAAQSTAYASAGAVDIASDPRQPSYACGTTKRADGFCSAGQTFTVAEQALSFTLAQTRSNFGMSYRPGGGNNQTVRFAELGSNGKPVNRSATPGIFAYAVPFTQASAQRVTDQQNTACDSKLTPTFNGVSGTSCWQIYQQGIGERQYGSGVAVYLQTDVKLPGCRADWCPTFTITASAAAVQAQDATQRY